MVSAYEGMRRRLTDAKGSDKGFEDIATAVLGRNFDWSEGDRAEFIDRMVEVIDATDGSLPLRLRKAAEMRECITVCGTDYMALPVDAKGAPIHIGDRVLVNGESRCVVGVTPTSVYTRDFMNRMSFSFSYNVTVTSSETLDDVLKDAVLCLTEDNVDIDDVVDIYCNRIVEAARRKAEE